MKIKNKSNSFDIIYELSLTTIVNLWILYKENDYLIVFNKCKSVESFV